jgi:GTP1/Obg family GTP-binding protein
MKKRVKEYRQQIYTIIEKIIQEKMRNCEEFYSDLVELCLDLIHPNETKISIETLNVLRITLELIC